MKNSIDVYISNSCEEGDISICFPRGFKYDKRHIVSIVYLVMFHENKD